MVEGEYEVVWKSVSQHMMYFGGNWNREFIEFFIEPLLNDTWTLDWRMNRNALEVEKVSARFRERCQPVGERELSETEEQEEL